MRLRCGTVLVILAALATTPLERGGQEAVAAPLRVIVQGRDPQSAAAAVAAAGGMVTRRLGIINAVGAALAPDQLQTLRRSPALVRIYEDQSVAVAGEGGRTTHAPRLVGADLLHASGITGDGVTIAFIDTGVWNTPGTLTDSAGAPRILAAYSTISDVSGLSATEDGNGHGTHVLSVAASSNYFAASEVGSSYAGIAPDASIVVVQAFDDNGWGRYSDVIAALDWVVANKNTYGIRVLNCSFGAAPRSHYWQDPLNQAVMRAWQAGIVVVTSAGNTGPASQTVRAPGNVPYVITVGAMTDSYTPDNPSDDRLASFSSTGPTYDRFVKPDVVAPGGHMLGLMPQKATVPREHPESLDADDSKHFTMSGTSPAAAVVSGAAALLLQAYPELTPDDVKCRFMASARSAVDASGHRAYSVFQEGAGLISIYDAVTSTATGCANRGLSLAEDLSGARHFGGRARLNADGTYSLDGSSGEGSTWDGQLRPGASAFAPGDPWTSSGDGDPWTESFAWPGGYPWILGRPWSGPLRETVAINVWVPQQ